MPGCLLSVGITALVKKEFNLTSDSPLALSIIKRLLSKYKENITYIAAGRFSIKIKAENYKEANQIMNNFIKEMEITSKKEGAKFEVLE